MERTKRWISLVRGLPSELQTDGALLDAILEDVADAIMARLTSLADEARQEIADFIESHPEARRLDRRDLFDLTEDERAQVMWFRGEVNYRRRRFGAIEDQLGYARDIAGVEPYLLARRRQERFIE